MWNASSGTIAEGNTFIDCQREIAFGLIERTPNDHTGGIVRNNFMYRNATIAGDAAIGVFDSPTTQVLHNTILASGTYASPIEYRFVDTAGVVIANNLLDGAILARDGAQATVVGNVVTASAALFVNASAGDQHLLPPARQQVDHQQHDQGAQRGRQQDEAEEEERQKRVEVPRGVRGDAQRIRR